MWNLLIALLMVVIVLYIRITNHSHITRGDMDCSQYRLQYGTKHRVPLPVYLKYHKVGSSTVTEFLRIFYNPNVTNWWNHTKCKTDPFDHMVPKHYQAWGLEGIRSRCVTCSRKSYTLVPIAVLRNPVERLISSFFFFHADLQKHTAFAPHSIKLSVQRFQTGQNLHLILPAHMTELIHYVRRRKIFSLPINEYEETLSQSSHSPFHSSQISLKRALHNLQTDIPVIGTTENLSTLLVLLSVVFQLNLSVACPLHLDYGQSKKNLKLFQSTQRPSREKLFRRDTLEAIRKEVSRDVILWRHAADFHIQRLAQYELSLDNASDIWNRTCHNVPISTQRSPRLPVIKEQITQRMKLNKTPLG